MGTPERLAGPLARLAQSVSQAFQDGAVDVGTRGHVGETDNGAARLRAGEDQPRRPERLEHQPVRTGRGGAHQVIEECFRFDALCIQVLVRGCPEFGLVDGTQLASASACR